jgi:hypothetical protein
MPRDDHEQRPSLRIYASSPESIREDVESVIAAASGDLPEREPTRVVGCVDVDAFEAHVGATKSVEPYGPREDASKPVTVPPKVHDLDRVELGPDLVAIVRIVPPRDRIVPRLVASAGLLVAIGFLLFLLAL